MPPRCQSPQPVGYPDASLSQPPGRGAAGRRPGGPRGGDAPGGCSDTAAPPPDGSAAGLPADTPGCSSAAPGRTRSRCRPPSSTGRTGTAGSPDAEPAPRSLDSGVKTGDDSHAGSASSRPLRRTGSCHRRNRPPRVCLAPFSLDTPPTSRAPARDDDAGCPDGIYALNRQDSAASGSRSQLPPQQDRPAPNRDLPAQLGSPSRSTSGIRGCN